MLCLSRKKNQTVIINPGPGQIVVTINRVSGNRVSLGFVAASTDRIVRGELNVETKDEVIEGVDVNGDGVIGGHAIAVELNDEPRIPNVVYHGPDVACGDESDREAA